MTQPAVSHHIKQLEQEVDAPLFVRNKAGLKLTPQGEIVVNYARRMKALHERMFAELQNAERHLSLLRIGITHTSESNLTAAALARYSNQKGKLKIILFTDTINNLYDMLENYELDLAIVDGAYGDPRFSSMLLDTDYLTCVMSVDNPLARKGAVTLAELRRQKMILRTPASATRTLFESALESNGESIQSFDVTLEVDNIATIKDPKGSRRFDPAAQRVSRRAAKGKNRGAAGGKSEHGARNEDRVQQGLHPHRYAQRDHQNLWLDRNELK